MKVTVNSWEDRDGQTNERMKINGNPGLWVGPLCECPEDAIIGRDLHSCQEIADLMQQAHAAGVAGEPFEYEVVNGREDE